MNHISNHPHSHRKTEATMDRIIIHSSAHETNSLSRIPSEIWLQILTLLPVKTLLLLRAVCKSLLSIIDDSDFISFHLRHFPQNLHQPRLLILHPNHQKALYQTRQINTSTVLQNTEPWLQTAGCWSLGGSLDGLILLLSTHLDANFSPTIFLWNPSVNKHRQLNLPSSSSKVTYFGIGYTRSDYKVICMSPARDQAWLYSLKTSCFTQILDSGFHPKFGDDTVYYPGLSFEYGVVWIEYCLSLRRTEYVPRLVWFDFGTEKFRYANEMPYSHPKKTPPTHSSLVVLDGGAKMGLLVVDDEEQASIWALETRDMTWIKRYKIALDVVSLGIRTTLRFIERDGKLTWIYSSKEDRNVKVLCYDIEMQAIKQHDKFEEFIGLNMCLYYESLVML